MDAPWPRLPDGRVVFAVYGVRLAVPTCATCLQSFEFWGDHAVGVIRMQTAIAEPRRLREMIAVASRITLTMQNNRPLNANLEPFLGRFDRKSLPATTRLDLNVFREERPLQCWANNKNPECVLLHGTATQPQAPGPDGFYVLPGPVASSVPGIGYITVKGSTLLVAPLGELEDALGLPLHIYCASNNQCDNSGHNGPPAFAVRRKVDIYFDFNGNRYERSKLKDLHAHVVEAVSSILLDSATAEHK